MDGLTVRPLGKGRFAPVASPDQRSLRAPLKPMTEALPLRHDQGAFAPLGTLTRAIAPLTTRRRLPRPGTHDQSFRALENEQAAFLPLHPDEGLRPSITRRTRCSCTSAGSRPGDDNGAAIVPCSKGRTHGFMPDR